MLTPPLDSHPEGSTPEPGETPDPHPDSVPQEQPPGAIPVETPAPGEGDVDNPGAVPSEEPGAPGKNHPDSRPGPGVS